VPIPESDEVDFAFSTTTDVVGFVEEEELFVHGSCCGTGGTEDEGIGGGCIERSSGVERSRCPKVTVPPARIGCEFPTLRRLSIVEDVEGDS
jgi:hypothetical protein